MKCGIKSKCRNPGFHGQYWTFMLVARKKSVTRLILSDSLYFVTRLKIDWVFTIANNSYSYQGTETKVFLVCCSFFALTMRKQ